MPDLLHEMMKATWIGSSFRRRDRTVHLDQPSHIFKCPAPDCEYTMTALTKDNIDTIRRTHVRTCHSELLDDVLWLEHFGVPGS